MPTRSRLRAAMPIICSLLLATACSSPAAEPAEAGSEKALAQDEEQKDRRGKRAGRVEGGSGERTGTPGRRSDRGSDGEGGRRDGERSIPGAQGESYIEDPAGDTENSGRSPGYIDIRAASIRDEGTHVRLGLTTTGPFPDRMDEGRTYVYVEFRIEGKSRGVSVAAEGDSSGWTPAIDGRRFRGTFRVDGRSMVFRVPWEAVGGKGSFRWHVSTSWTQAKLLSTDYSFDRAPDGILARYPAG